MSKHHSLKNDLEVIENLKAKITALKGQEITRDEIIHIGKYVYPTLSVGKIRTHLETKRAYDVANLENILRFAENRLPKEIEVVEIIEEVAPTPQVTKDDVKEIIEKIKAVNVPHGTNKRKAVPQVNENLLLF